MQTVLPTLKCVSFPPENRQLSFSFIICCLHLYLGKVPLMRTSNARNTLVIHIFQSALQLIVLDENTRGIPSQFMRNSSWDSHRIKICRWVDSIVIIRWWALEGSHPAFICFNQLEVIQKFIAKCKVIRVCVVRAFKHQEHIKSVDVIYCHYGKLHEYCSSHAGIYGYWIIKCIFLGGILNDANEKFVSFVDLSMSYPSKYPTPSPSSDASRSPIYMMLGNGNTPVSPRMLEDFESMTCSIATGQFEGFY